MAFLYGGGGGSDRIQRSRRANGVADHANEGENAQPRMKQGFPEACAALAQHVFAEWAQSTAVTRSHDVAEAIWRAVTDPASPMRLAAGKDALALVEAELAA